MNGLDLSGPSHSIYGSNVRPSPTRRGTTLSRIISKATPSEPGELSFAAFKALPIDPARSRQGSSGSFADYAAGDDLSDATNATEAVEIIVAALASACADMGNVTENLLVDQDVVR
jgi:phosphatidylinositol 4-phosphatase